jgi:SWI/SNF-related matrix-associated actin-dependent regulator of chromatin subfamily A3
MQAHYLRNQKTAVFKAATALSSHIRWCLTGTPIQNTIEDIAALVRFLRVPVLESTSEFRKYIAKPVESSDSWGFENFKTLLKSICIRRTKDLLKIPEPKTVELQLYLSPAEKSHYLRVGELHRKAFDDAVCGRKTADAYRTVFQVLIKLRMICNHGTLVVEDAPSLNGENDDTLAVLQDGIAICAYCGEDVITDGAMEDCAADRLQACSHIVCRACESQYHEDLERLNNGFCGACPLCKEPLQEARLNPQIYPVLSEAKCSPKGISTKLSKLLEDVREHRFSDKW